MEWLVWTILILLILPFVYLLWVAEEDTKLMTKEMHDMYDEMHGWIQEDIKKIEEENAIVVASRRARGINEPR